MAKQPIAQIGLKNNPITIEHSIFRGKKYIDVRKNFTTGSGENIPTRKGLMLTNDQWFEVIEVLLNEPINNKTNLNNQATWVSQLNSAQNVDLVVEFKNSLTNVILSEEFRFRLENKTKTDILVACLRALTQTLCEYDELESLQKICKKIATEI